MSDAAAQIDPLMEQASQALTQTDYLRCERLCVEALTMARQAEDFDRYARILLPLQEARRQRRQAALDLGVTVLTARPADAVVESLLDAHQAGCLLLIDPPFTADDEHRLRETALQRELMVEVLRLDQQRLRSTFEHEMELLGDTQLTTVPRTGSVLQRLDALATVLDRVGDHEIAHQRLAEAARQASHEQAAKHS